MAVRKLFVAATDRAEAQEVGNLIAAGKIGHLDHYLTEASAQALADFVNRNAERDGRTVRRRVYPVDIRSVDDGVIANVWPVDRVGDVAAALTLFALIPLVGFASLWEHFA